MEDIPITVISVIAPHVSEEVPVVVKQEEARQDDGLVKSIAAMVAGDEAPQSDEAPLPKMQVNEAGLRRSVVAPVDEAPACKQQCIFETAPRRELTYNSELDANTLIGSLAGSMVLGAGIGMLVYWAFSGKSAVTSCAPPISSP